jgi:YARHG domain
MRLMSIAGAALLLATTVGVPVASAQDCQSLWVERNTYYKQAGYCFRTQRAIQYFGNGGCYIYNQEQIRFAPNIRRRIADIMRVERAWGCPR